MRGQPSNPNFILEEIPESERTMSPVDSEEDEGEGESEVPFTKQMRIATRKIHNISDTLVNAKLGLALSDDKIWAEGLLIFYEIFKFLELAMMRLAPKNEPFKRMQRVIAGIERTVPFEQDLEFYYRPGYLKEYQVRETVRDYLKHLKVLEEREPLRLLAYIYHLYMGLLSGGQILKKKRERRDRMRKRVNSVLQWFGIHREQSSEQRGNLGEAVTTFCDGRSIKDIKKEIAFTMDDIAQDLSRDEKNSLLEESTEVFRRNNQIVGSIEGTGMVALKNYAAAIIFVLSVGSAIYLYLNREQYGF